MNFRYNKKYALKNTEGATSYIKEKVSLVFINDLLTL